MSTRATSILRGRSLFRSIGIVTIICTAIAAFAALGWNAVSAQRALPNAVSVTVTINEGEIVDIDTTIPVDPAVRDKVIITQGPIHGTAQGIDPVAGQTYKIRYASGADDIHDVSFRYQICTKPTEPGPQTCGEQATVIVRIRPVNDRPQAIDDTARTKVNASVLIDVLDNDTGGPNEPTDSVSLVSVTSPAAGTAVVEGRQIRYTPSTNLFTCPAPSSAIDRFTYRIADRDGLVSDAEVIVTVACLGTPLIKIGNPSPADDHMFLVDIWLESEDVDVGAVDFFLMYDGTCLTDPDAPSNNMLADDTVPLPPVPASPDGFERLVADDSFPGRLHFALASTRSPFTLAGPSASATRKLAVVKFKALPTCNPTTATWLMLAEQVNNNGLKRGFADPDGGNIVGDVETPKRISLRNINNAPREITLSHNTVLEGSPNGTFIGVFSTSDPDTGDTHTYDLVSPGGLFGLHPLVNNELQTAIRARDLIDGEYLITVGSTDSFGVRIQRDFTIKVINRNQPPVAGNDPQAPIIEIIVEGRTTIPYDSTLKHNDDDPDDGCINCTIQSVTNGAKGTVTTDGLNITYTATDPVYRDFDTFRYTITDNDPNNAMTSSADVTVRVRQDRAPGDCNKDGVIGAADLTATAREMFDAPAGTNWYDVPLGRYSYSPYGCNSYVDMNILATDLACTARKIFNNSAVCILGLQASSVATANLAVGDKLSAAPGATVQVPVILTSAGNAVASAGFALDFDATALNFDTTDADGDGLPDAVSLNIPGNTFALVEYNETESRVEIAITGLADPMPLLADGAIATVTLTVNPDVSLGETALELTESSLSSDQIVTIPVEVTNGSVAISDQVQLENRVLLPLINR